MTVIDVDPHTTHELHDTPTARDQPSFGSQRLHGRLPKKAYSVVIKSKRGLREGDDDGERSKTYAIVVLSWDRAADLFFRTLEKNEWDPDTKVELHECDLEWDKVEVPL